MKIDEVLQSINFEDNYERAVINIHYTYGWLNNVFRSELKKFDLTVDDIQNKDQAMRIFGDLIAGNLSEEEAETLIDLLDKVRR